MIHFNPYLLALAVSLTIAAGGLIVYTGTLCNRLLNILIEEKIK
jgi:hypothetical protein